MAITVTFDPPLPSDDPATFNTKAFTLLGDLNDWSTEANSLASTVNSNASSASSSASTATTQASNAATSASNASTSASNASSSASAASTSASNASTSASNASTSATNASNSAADAAASAASITLVVGGSVTLSSGEVPKFQANGTDSRWSYSATRWSANANGTGFFLGKSRGASVGSNAIVQSGDELGRITWSGDDGTDLNSQAARIRVEVDGTPGADDMPGRIVFATTADGANSPTDRMWIYSDGSVKVSGNFTINSTGALGYEAGAGGSTTQTTSRTTGVTLNKTCGIINLYTAAGSTTATTFTVTNSKVSATDTVVLSVKDATNTYLAFVTRVTDGAFDITFYTTGGTSSDTPGINFSIIKAALS